MNIIAIKDPRVPFRCSQSWLHIGFKYLKMPVSGLHAESIETVPVWVGQISQLCQSSLSDSDAY